MIELLGESRSGNREKEAVPFDLKSPGHMRGDEKIGLWNSANRLRYVPVYGAQKTGGQILRSRLTAQVAEKGNDRGGGTPST